MYQAILKIILIALTNSISSGSSFIDIDARIKTGKTQSDDFLARLKRMLLRHVGVQIAKQQPMLKFYLQ